MSENWTYKTIKEYSSAQFKEKGSRFIGLIVACYTEEEVKARLAEWRLEHNQATHVCYAFRLGTKGERYRANDDGEPSNSAGQPILGQLISAGITNVLCAVVRYYGGTKLGVGGLVQAYREAAKMAIDASTIVEREEEKLLRIEFDYSDMPSIMSILKRHTQLLNAPVIGNSCNVDIACTIRNLDLLTELLNVYHSISITTLNNG